MARGWGRPPAAAPNGALLFDNLAEHLHLPFRAGRRIAARSRGPGLGDNLGTIRDLAILNVQTGVTSVANHRVYDSYGNLTKQTSAAVDCVFGFARFSLLDKATGLEIMGRRAYSPSTGTWLSEDPSGFTAEDTNASRYCGNSPTDATDPSGQDPFGLPPPQLSGGLNTEPSLPDPTHPPIDLGQQNTPETPPSAVPPVPPAAPEPPPAVEAHVTIQPVFRDRSAWDIFWGNPPIQEPYGLVVWAPGTGPDGKLPPPVVIGTVAPLPSVDGAGDFADQVALSQEFGGGVASLKDVTRAAKLAGSYYKSAGEHPGLYQVADWRGPEWCKDHRPETGRGRCAQGIGPRAEAHRAPLGSSSKSQDHPEGKSDG